MPARKKFSMYLLDNDLKIKPVCDKAGIDRNTVYRWLKRSHTPRPESVDLLLDTLQQETGKRPCPVAIGLIDGEQK